MAQEPSPQQTIDGDAVAFLEVYLSHSSHDADLVSQLQESLGAAGLRVWRFEVLDESLLGGHDWRSTVLDEIRRCDVLVAVLSRASVESRECATEWGYAEALGKPIIPVRVETALPFLPPQMIQLQVIDYVSGDPGVEARLVAAIYAASRIPLPDPLPPPPEIPAPSLLETSEPEANASTSTTVLGIIAEHGYLAHPIILDFIRLGAAVQYELRHGTGVRDVSELTRSSALWATANLDHDIAEILNTRGMSQAELTRLLGLNGAPDPTPVDDVEIHDEFARALRTYLTSITPPRMIRLVDIAIAVLRDAQVHGGLLGDRLADVDITGAVADLDQLQSVEPAAPVEEASAQSSAPAPGRALAGLGVDMVDDSTRLSDELHVVDDVVTLCDVLAARGAAPPISVGLFGRWGSGKSYFMALMRRRIDELRHAARGALERGEETTYCTEIVQVTFNAWHYMDADDLWATMAVHLFGAIAQVDPDDRSARPRADVVRDLKRREEMMETVDRRITRALGDHRLDEAAARMGLESHRAAMLDLLHEVGTTISYASAGKVFLTKTWRTRRRRWSLMALATTFAALIALGVAMVAGALSGEWLLAWVPVALTAVGTAGRWLRGIKNGLAQVNRVAAESGLQPHDVTAERVDNDRQILALREELEAIDRLTGIRDWVQERALSSDYTSHFGVISVLRGDLEALVEKQRRDAPDRRIILYIDDLDRCSPARVVEVLQAVHLLLAFPLFVAVVGVDPRWLLKSLERHYLQIQSLPGKTANDAADLLTETTPHDYLEKIFQIPFSLRQMEVEGFGRLIGSVAGPPAKAVQSEDEGEANEAPDATLENGKTSGVDEHAKAEESTTASSEASVDAPTEPMPDPPAVGGQTASRQSAQRDEMAPVSPNPPQLQITEAEVAALARMGPLIGTPRAAKRLVNLYRLIRAGLPVGDIERFVDEAQFRALAIVLAAQVGFPRSSSRLLGELVKTDGDPSITKRVDAIHADHLEPANVSDHADWVSLTTVLRAVCIAEDGQTLAEFDRPMSELRVWIPRLRRYSFEGALGML